ncbi:hypothetical protein ACFQ9J_26755 [Streptomyces sp. NPDC056529]|uniref:hypothetical protein n=1 Tax=Streptomyces sp. NPDC056529 TaxID=3345855 RepID=UPI00369351EF
MNTLSIPHTLPRITGNCPTCTGTFETCRCGEQPVARTVRTGKSVRAWVGEDIHEEDEAKGYEHEPEARLHQLVQHLVADGDRRARTIGRPARRTREQMMPGHQRPELLSMTGPAHGTGGRPVRGGEAAVA